MIWVVYALLSSFFQAAFAETNRIAKLDPWHLNVWHCGTSALILLLAIPWMAFETSAFFILAVFIGATVLVIGSVVQFFLSSQHNGRVSSMFLPIRAFGTFLVWILIFPASFFTLLTNPIAGIGVLSAFLICIGSIIAIRRNDIGWRSFLLVAPIGMLFAISNVIVTLALPKETSIPPVLAVTFLIYVIAFFQIIAVLAGQKKLDANLITRRNLIGGTLIGFFSVLSFVFLFLSFVASPNPAFPSILTMLGPVWIMVYHKIRGIKDDASPRAGLAMIIGAIILIWATAL